MRNKPHTRNEALLIVLAALLLLPVVHAAEPLPTSGPGFDQVLVNSNDWQDVYQGLLLGRLTGKPADYLLTPSMAPDVVRSLPQTQRRVLLIEPRRSRQNAGVRELLNDAGFVVVDVPGEGEYGPRLLSLIDARGIIITDARYPYNAISLAPYALQRQSFVLFSGPDGPDAITGAVEDEDVPVLLYGIIDNAVAQALEPFNPRIIDEGGKFDNNIRIAQEFISEAEPGQVVLTNGEFIEESLITDFNPVVFIGRSNVPDQTLRFLGESDIKVAVVVGNYLADVASDLKRSLKREYGKDVSFIVKFAKTPRSLDTQFTQPTALEYFALPIINPELAVATMTYNQLTGQLEVTYENPSEIAAFFISSITLEAGDQTFSLGDDGPQTISGGQRKTLLYEVETQASSLSAQTYVIYGDYPDSLELSTQQSFEDVPIISVADYAELDIRKVVYDKTDGAFYITLHNPGDVPTYAGVELIDVIVDGLPVTVGTRTSSRLEPQETKQVFVRAQLSDLDLLENEEVRVRASYGQREGVLSKRTETTLELDVRLIKQGYVLAGAAAVALLIILFFLYGRARTYTCDRCGHRLRARKSPRRHDCGGRFRKS